MMNAMKGSPRIDVVLSWHWNAITIGIARSHEGAGEPIAPTCMLEFPRYVVHCSAKNVLRPEVSVIVDEMISVVVCGLCRALMAHLLDAFLEREPHQQEIMIRVLQIRHLDRMRMPYDCVAAVDELQSLWLALGMPAMALGPSDQASASACR